MRQVRADRRFHQLIRRSRGIVVRNGRPLLVRVRSEHGHALLRVGALEQSFRPLELADGAGNLPVGMGQAGGDRSAVGLCDTQRGNRDRCISAAHPARWTRFVIRDDYADRAGVLRVLDLGGKSTGAATDQCDVTAYCCCICSVERGAGQPKVASLQCHRGDLAGQGRFIERWAECRWCSLLCLFCIT